MRYNASPGSECGLQSEIKVLLESYKEYIETVLTKIEETEKNVNE